MKGLFSVLLLIASNVFMTLAWYGHLKFKDLKWFQHVGFFGIVMISWGIALFEDYFTIQPQINY